MKRLTIVVHILTVSLAVLYIRFMLIPYAQLPWDEAMFISRSFKLYTFLRLFQFHEVFANIFNPWQFSYPPLQELSIALVSLPFSFSITLSKLTSAGWVCVSVFFIYKLHMTITSSQKYIRSILTAVFFLTSPLILLYGAIAMKESMGCALTIALFYQYLTAKKSGKLIHFFLTSLVLSAVFLTKYQYTIIPILTIMLDLMIEKISLKNRTISLIHLLVICIPCAVISGLWILFPVNHIHVFTELLKNSENLTGGYAPVIDYVLFHPRALLYMYAPSVIIGALFVFSLIMTIPFWRQPLIRISLFMSWISIMLSTIHYTNIQERYILPSVPFIMVLSAFICTMYFRIIMRWSTNRMIRVTGVLVLSSLLVFVLRDTYQSSRTIYAMGSVTQKGPLFTQQDYKDAWFVYDPHMWPKNMPWEAKEVPMDIVKFVAQNIDVTKEYWVYGLSGFFPPGLFSYVFDSLPQSERIVDNKYDKYAITITTFPDSFYYTRDYELFAQYQEYQTQEYIQSHEDTLIAKKKFEFLGIEIAMYGEKY